MITPAFIHIIEQVGIMPPVDRLVRRDVLADLACLEDPLVEAVRSDPCHVGKENHEQHAIHHAVLLVATVDRVR